MNKITFKKITNADDWKIILNLEKQIKNSDSNYIAFTTMPALKKYLGNSIGYILYDTNKPIGYISAKIENGGNNAEITGFIITPGYRGKGFGKIAFNKLLKDLSNIEQVYFMTHPDNNPMMKIGLQSGFKIKGKYEDFYGNGQPRIRLERWSQAT